MPLLNVILLIYPLLYISYITRLNYFSCYQMNESCRKQQGIVLSLKVLQSGLHTFFTTQASWYVTLRTNQF